MMAQVLQILLLQPIGVTVKECSVSQHIATHLPGMRQMVVVGVRGSVGEEHPYHRIREEIFLFSSAVQYSRMVYLKCGYLLYAAVSIN